jgi:hypothetical protein
MNELPMPSDVKASDKENVSQAPGVGGVEPPSVKLVVRLFLIPAIIVAVAVGIMLLIGRMAGGEPSLEEALARLKNPGGERTAAWMVGPASKQRYMDAKALTDKMKEGMRPEERIELSKNLVELLRGGYVHAEEGEVQHFVLLAIGRVWQIDPTQGKLETPEARDARAAAMKILTEYASANDVPTRKAAVFAPVFWKGYDDVQQALPGIVAKLNDVKEDLDVRMAAATVLGVIGSAWNANVVEALRQSLRDDKPEDAELVWDSALSLSELGLPDGQDTVLKLLDRKELASLKYFDRESDPKNPTFRTLSEEEQQRILINAMEGVKNLKSPVVVAKLQEIAEKDPSQRVRWQGKEVLREMKVPPR